MSDRAWTRADALAVAVLAVTAFVIGLPILTDGYLTYFDNAPHLAEIHSLAGDGADGWSRIGFAGVAIDTLHSPVFWRGLAALDRLGVDIERVYAVCVCVGLAAPALAVFAVARRRLPRGWAFALAYLVLVQRTAIVGTASASGGMWTFYLACAGLILLADRLARPTTGRRDVVAIAALLGFIGLTHLFVLVGAALLVAVHAAWAVLALRHRAAEDPGRPRLVALARRDAIAGALAVVASAAYWFPQLGATADLPETQTLALGQLARLLVTPTDVLALTSAADGASALPAYLECIPLVGLLALGAGGALLVRRRDADPLPAYGALLAGLVLFLLVCSTQRPISLLGPVPWRFLYLARVGAALAALPLLVRLAARLEARRATGRMTPLSGRPPVVAAAAAIAVASGLLWGAPLRRDVASADGPEMRDVDALWTWLRANVPPNAGRVFIQDTFGADPVTDPLATSHVLALTLDRTGVEPLGPFYGVIPAATVVFVRGEFGLLFGGQLTFMRDGTRVLNAPVGSWDVALVVTATREAADTLRDYGWERVHAAGRFTIWRHEPAHRAPVGVIQGRYLTVELDEPDGSATIANAYHRYWRVVRGPDATTLSRSPSGRLTIGGLPPGAHTIILEYKPPPVWAASAVGWLAIALGAFAARRKNALPSADA
jgi:hypothetical protein